MRGLVFIESLQISGVQWVAMLVGMALYLSSLRFEHAALMAQGVMSAAFFGSVVSVDFRMLFHEAAYLQRFGWSAFLSEIVQRNYVHLQPPFYTFFVSRMPSFRGHQVYALAWAILCVALLFALFGERARLMAATPVWLLMSTQPSNDVVLFGMLLCSLRCVQLGHRVAGALLFGIAYPIKPLAVLLLPSMAWRLRGWVFLSLMFWGGYVLWSLHYYFGVKQWNFFLHQVCIR